jgi:hypothetical protein
MFENFSHDEVQHDVVFGYDKNSPKLHVVIVESLCIYYAIEISTRSNNVSFSIVT